ncbi:hypothetical protein [Clostridium cellulovorans]|uniref:Uncharacterized protein n=1 Tax=Clostridium cellulovorans (strain ATCC 35296 / DSM 3052 / OCM 3 / 743B) TaxID=573061 RepID=D9STZ6_CLOC7|nr:hypothetical protein [Clostridium cellulovorans]ADL50834.1 hypothetical protein Clocel_1075 [Clostridium cellulovorans 743B]
MKKSKKLFVVGDKSSKTGIIFISLITFFFVAVQIGNSANTLIGFNKNWGIFAGILFVIIGVFEIPVVVATWKHWDISEEYLEYYDNNDYFQQWRYLISIFKGREDVCAFKIRLTEIKSIKIYWNRQYAHYSTINYTIYFGVALKDGSILTFRSLIGSDKKGFLDALNYLKERYFIEIDDAYNVLGVLADPNQNLHEYIQKIEKNRFLGEGMKDD